MPDAQTNEIDDVLELLISQGSDGMATAFARLFNMAMRIERENFLGARHYERSESRRGYANRVKSKRIDTPAGTVTVQVPKTADADEPFYPQSLERGTRSTRAVMLAIAEMYVKGVSTRDVEAVLEKLGVESLSSTRSAGPASFSIMNWRNGATGRSA